MTEFKTFDSPIEFNPDYEWPNEDAELDCPKCDNPLTLNIKRIDYKGKPWWCGKCRWQFSNEEATK